MTIKGTLETRDNLYTSFLTGAIAYGAFILAMDVSYLSSVSGVIIGDTTHRTGDSTFLQNTELYANDLSIQLRDSTYMGGTLVDGTYMDGTYLNRSYDPLWINYSIWKYVDSTTTLQGYRYRMPIKSQVGDYYANMMTTRPGDYEIQWMYQKDRDSLAKIVAESFTVSSWGIDSTFEG